MASEPGGRTDDRKVFAPELTSMAMLGGPPMLRPRFRLSTLMVVVAAMSLAFGGGAEARRRWRNNRERAAWHSAMQREYLQKLNDKNNFRFFLIEREYAAVTDPDRHEAHYLHRGVRRVTPERRMKGIAAYVAMKREIECWRDRASEHARLAQEYQRRWW